MNEWTLTKTRLFEGVWEGVLTRAGEAEAAPEIEVTHQQAPVAGVEVTAKPEEKLWVVRVPVPVEKIADGVQTFVIRDRRSGEVLDSFALLAGDVLSYDIRAEMALLREELDLLKRAFRRHCLDTM
ncbi:MAG: hypothetical protein KBT70_04840 [Roseovarius sp.]|jgi:hypothetical protein|uniref:hypothetical protein n=1 Tax=Roseovarius sp. TaxID=1486281 RepID=UPI001B77ED4A|nr:hypothetical protein [Roseovarius sp.]MBQ0749507.1 hypothetical protein [Roseovarius sp.]MBQ0811091.1 hypothetical protein [Roseovarius sp.]